MKIDTSRSTKPDLRPMFRAALRSPGLLARLERLEKLMLNKEGWKGGKPEQ